MALNLKNIQVETLATELALLSGKSKTEVIRLALLEKKQHLQAVRGRDSRLSAMRFLEERVWPSLPADASRTLSREEEDQILGYGPDGAPL